LLQRSQLQGCNLTNANLRGAKLDLAYYDSQTQWSNDYDYRKSGAVGPKAHLVSAFLNTSNLKGVDLTRANLRGAYLSGADLTGANLTEAALSGANLKYAFLTGANLKNAILIGVELEGADLRATNIKGANFDNLQSIAGADFTLARGIDETMRGIFASFPSQELNKWNKFTRNNTKNSLALQ